MEKELGELISYCRKYKKVVCYGAGWYGVNVKKILELNNIKVSFFLISDEISDIKKRSGIPVISMKKKAISLDGACIILSLNTTYYMEIKRELLKIKNERDIYLLNDDFEQKLSVEINLINRKNMLFLKGEDDYIPANYKKRINNLMDLYKKVNVKFIHANGLGDIGEWIGYCNRKIDQGVYELYFPVSEQSESENTELGGANKYLLEKLNGENMEVISNSNLEFWRCFIRARREFFEFDNKIGFAMQMINLREILNRFDFNKNYIKFNEKEEKIGKMTLRKMKIYTEYICLSNRDDLYYKLRGINLRSFIDEYRNSKIETRHHAIQYLYNKEILSIRMGSAIKDGYNQNGLINYGEFFRTEFMDLYLAAKCKFFVCDSSGICTLGLLFSKPEVITNVALLTIRGDAIPFLHYEKDLFILKKMWNMKKKSYLTIREMLKWELDCRYSDKIAYNTFRLYKENEIIPIENTDDEILEVIQEMNQRLDGQYQYDELDLRLQKKYKDIISEFDFCENIFLPCRLGASFLRKNQWLLD